MKLAKYLVLQKYFIFIALSFLCSMGCRERKPVVTLLFAGDLMPDRGIRSVIEQKGIESLFRNLPYDLSAVDYTVVNLECPVCDSTMLKVEKRFAFRANPEWLAGFQTQGISIVSLANNHSGDCGEGGLLQTLDRVQGCGICAVGANKNPQRAGMPLVISRGKIRIALFASSFLQSDSRYMCRASAKELEKLIRTYKAIYPHTVVVLLLHWGVEGTVHPTTGQLQVAHRLVDAGVDVLVGTHPHVVQPVEHYKTGLIFYSLGNFIFDNNRPPENKGMMARLKIGERGLVDMDTVTFNVYPGYGR
jgi:poly-gamma-glutamate synthesis protein (capsule biosynthesis protein)